MMYKIFVPIAACGVIVLAGCTSDSDTPEVSDVFPEMPSLTVDEKTELQSTFDVSYSLMNALDQAIGSEEKQNYVASPLGVIYDLAMSANVLDSEQSAQILEKLLPKGGSLESLNNTLEQYSSTVVHKTSQSQLALANSLWTRFDLASEQQAILEKYYGIEGATVDFSSSEGAAQINAWISDKTYGEFTNFYSPGQGDKVMVLLNAIVHKGNWYKEFDDPQDGSFTNCDMSVSTAKMMTGRQHVDYAEYNDGVLVSWSYKNQNISFSVFLPNQIETGALDYRYMNASTSTDSDLEPLSKASGNVMVTMPVFDFVCDVDLLEALKSIGITYAFDAANHFMSIDKIAQRVSISVDQNGSEAKAVTEVNLSIGAPAPSSELPEKIEVNRPFLFEVKAYGVPVIAGRIGKL